MKRKAKAIARVLKAIAELLVATSILIASIKH